MKNPWSWAPGISLPRPSGLLWITALFTGQVWWKQSSRGHFTLPNTLVTADYPGVLLREIEKRRGGTGVFLNGPLGGMVTPDVQGHTFE